MMSSRKQSSRPSSSSPGALQRHKNSGGPGERLMQPKYDNDPRPHGRLGFWSSWGHRVPCGLGWCIAIFSCFFLMGLTALVIWLIIQHQPEPPVACFTSTRNVEKFYVNASCSYSRSDHDLTYEWDFGDGTTLGPLNQPLAEHTYAGILNVVVWLTVRDEAGLDIAVETLRIVAIPDVCGNGAVEIGEQCDDGNTIDGDGCSSICGIETCGNGVLDPGEECDDGNIINGDGCSPTCKIQGICGNGVLELGEQCDLGVALNDGSYGGCNFDCTLAPFCGDGVLQIGNGEQCDDGNQINGDGCTDMCISENPVCGNGIVETGEQCDDGGTLGGDGCSATCQFEICGNSVLDFGEQCDDGNVLNGDGCSSTCQREPTCGDGFVEGIEQCDDGNTQDGDGCSSTCVIENVCGNGILEPGNLETCDDGNTQDGDGCSSICILEAACGDGILDFGEQCDDGNLVDGDGCSSTCVIEEVCGNGIVELGEQCDDGNTQNGDGCDDTCQIEVTCGNAKIEGPEGCDDANAVSGDGCSSSCQVEAGWVCPIVGQQCYLLTAPCIPYQGLEYTFNYTGNANDMQKWSTPPGFSEAVVFAVAGGGGGGGLGAGGAGAALKGYVQGTVLGWDYPPGTELDVWVGGGGPGTPDVGGPGTRTRLVWNSIADYPVTSYFLAGGGGGYSTGGGGGGNSTAGQPGKFFYFTGNPVLGGNGGLSSPNAATGGDGGGMTLTGEGNKGASVSTDLYTMFVPGAGGGAGGFADLARGSGWGGDSITEGMLGGRGWLAEGPGASPGSGGGGGASAFAPGGDGARTMGSDPTLPATWGMYGSGGGGGASNLDGGWGGDGFVTIRWNVACGFCGNGIVEAGEVCDVGINDGSYNSCSPDCQVRTSFCGDGVRNVGYEMCDDGNTVDGDGCSSSCLVEPGYYCASGGTNCFVPGPSCSGDEFGALLGEFREPGTYTFQIARHVRSLWLTGVGGGGGGGPAHPSNPADPEAGMIAGAGGGSGFALEDNRVSIDFNQTIVVTVGEGGSGIPYGTPSTAIPDSNGKASGFFIQQEAFLIGLLGGGAGYGGGGGGGGNLSVGEEGEGAAGTFRIGGTGGAFHGGNGGNSFIQGTPPPPVELETVDPGDRNPRRQHGGAGGGAGGATALDGVSAYPGQSGAPTEFAAGGVSPPRPGSGGGGGASMFAPGGAAADAYDQNRMPLATTEIARKGRLGSGGGGGAVWRHDTSQGLPPQQYGVGAAGADGGDGFVRLIVDYSCPRCGNGYIDPGEECDNGENNGDFGGGCNNQCEIEGKFKCQGSNANSGGCIPACGDGIVDVEFDEECDEGQDNGLPSSSCSRDCEVVCGESSVTLRGAGTYSVYVPPSVEDLRIRLIGGGGGGGGGDTSSPTRGGGGGQRGSFVDDFLLPANISGGFFPLILGAGGLGGTADNGGAPGGFSEFQYSNSTPIVTTPGGAGGLAGPVSGLSNNFGEDGQSTDWSSGGLGATSLSPATEGDRGSGGGGGYGALGLNDFGAAGGDGYMILTWTKVCA